MPERDEPRPSTREVAGDDFLFHLARGSELLQESRVHDAKAELEQALALQPSDPKGQDLLGIVYFRLGLYPRAITIYERLIHLHPGAIEPRINLALCYLKTGQPAQARAELEKVLEHNPQHNRAWGYLGLAFQRLGDLERAAHAFAAGGHEAMARRLFEMAGAGAPPAEPARAEVRRAAVAAAHALDAGGFRRDSDLPRLPSGLWSATEPGREPLPVVTPQVAPRGPAAAPPEPDVREVPAPLLVDIRGSGSGEAGPAPRAPADIRGSGSGEAGPAPRAPADAPPGAEPTNGLSVARIAVPREAEAAPAASQPPVGLRGAALSEAVRRPDAAGATRFDPHARPPSSPPPPSSMPTFAARAPEGPLAFTRERLLVFPRDLPLAQHPSGVVLVQAPKGFATRLGAVRALTGAIGREAQPLERHARGRALGEPLGGAAAPIVEIPGRCELVLGPPEGKALRAFAIEDEPLYLREDALIGFEPSVAFENGRLAAGDGEAIPMVQLRGRGGVVAALPESAAALEVTNAWSTAVLAASVLGWIGRLLPRALPPAEAPGAARGLVVFAGEGMVLVDGR